MTLARNLAKLRSAGSINSTGQINPSAIEGGLTYSGTISYVASNSTLPLNGNSVGDMAYWTNNGLYYWDGADWNLMEI